MPYKIGSFNLIPAFGVMALCVSGIGALPYYLRRLMHGEYPRPKDDYERFSLYQKDWDAGASYATTNAYKEDKDKQGLELEWRKLHPTVAQ